jgi:small subunit ribosomal protein S8
MYYRLLPEIKNALQAGKEKTTFPFSRMDFSILKVLEGKGYIKSVEEEVNGKKSMLVVRFGGKRNSGATMDFKVLSKPSRRSYVDYRSLHRVRQGYGLGVLSTSEGIMSDMDAKKKKVGGEYLFQIW